MNSPLPELVLMGDQGDVVAAGRGMTIDLGPAQAAVVQLDEEDVHRAMLATDAVLAFARRWSGIRSGDGDGRSIVGDLDEGIGNERVVRLLIDNHHGTY